MEAINEDERYARDLALPPFPSIDEDYLPENVTVHFHFAPHGEPRHLEGAQELFQQADILIPESYGWHEQMRKQMLAITKGDNKAFNRAVESQPTNREWKKTLFEMIRRSWKPLLFIESELAQAQEEGFSIRHGRGDLRDRVAADSVEATLDNFADDMAESARRASNRDRIMVANLGPRLSELVSGHPKLRDKKEVRALSLLGTHHMPVYEYLAGQSATQDAVEATEWSGTGYLAINYEVMTTYGRRSAPTKQQMVRLMISEAVRSSSVEGKSLYDENSLYGRGVDPGLLAAQALVEVMIEDQPDGAQLAADILRSRPGAKQYDEDRFRAYAEAAGKRLDKLGVDAALPSSTPTH